MRVLFLNYEYPPLGGGAGNATKYILKEFSEYGDVKLDVITSSSDFFGMENIGDNITIYKLPIGKKPGGIHSQSRLEIIKYSFKAFLFAKQLIGKNKYDLSHSFFTVPCGFLSLVLKLRYKIPYVISLRGADVPGYTDRFKILYIFIKPLVGLIWKNSFAVVSNSDKLRDLALVTNKKQKISVIFNGIDTREFYPGNFKSEEKKEDFSILFVSRLCQRKGAIFLLEAIEELVKSGYKIKSIFVGDGEQKKELQKFAQEHEISDEALFCGKINHDDLPRIYQSADVFVFPSLNEGMSNALLEALASGLPVIVTDVGGTQELIKNKINGFIVPLRNAKAIATALKELINNSEMRKRMRSENRKKAENMSWENVAREYLNIYKSVIK
ncbi:MAG: glycosyltransferase family 4 protein [Candidatus Pacebacteria bacterium]|nr:glycosyltransferase family 4 protein [Candidatus Paceibacterota bacterium]